MKDTWLRRHFKRVVTEIKVSGILLESLLLDA